MINGTCERIPDHIIAGYPAACAPPGHHTDAELHRLVRLLRAARVRTINIGHGRHCTSIAAAAAMNAAWTGPGERVEQIVSWPQDAASWLRPARRIAAGECDGWVIADTPVGFAQLSRRLAHEKRWSPPQTFGFASLASPDLTALTGTLLSGMTGATSAGGFWLIRHQTLVIDEDPASIHPTEFARPGHRGLVANRVPMSSGSVDGRNQWTCEQEDRARMDDPMSITHGAGLEAACAN